MKPKSQILGNTSDEIRDILARAKRLEQRYRTLTGKPLGVSGEVAEFEAARLLGLELVDARQAGYDAIRRVGKKTQKLQIKRRCILPGASESPRLGKIDPHNKFDAVLLVLMNESLDATVIFEAAREPVIAALTAPGSKARNERGLLGVAKFRSIANAFGRPPRLPVANRGDEKSLTPKDRGARRKRLAANRATMEAGD